MFVFLEGYHWISYHVYWIPRQHVSQTLIKREVLYKREASTNLFLVVQIKLELM